MHFNICVGKAAKMIRELGKDVQCINFPINKES